MKLLLYIQSLSMESGPPFTVQYSIEFQLHCSSGTRLNIYTWCLDDGGGQACLTRQSIGAELDWNLVTEGHSGQ